MQENFCRRLPGGLGVLRLHRGQDRQSEAVESLLLLSVPGEVGADQQSGGLHLVRPGGLHQGGEEGKELG